MLFSLILCTLGNRDIELERLLTSLKNQNYKSFELIVVTQLNHEKVASILSKYDFKIIHVQIDKVGLSLSRNVGLKHCSGDYITISDDDCWYNPDSLEIIRDFALKNDKYSGYAFQIFDPYSNVYYKSYSVKPYNLTLFHCRKISSIEFFFTRDLISKGINFDENFGLGAKYPSGEENIFIASALNNGFSFVYYPEIIVNHRQKSHYSRKLTLSFLREKFAVFCRIYGFLLGLILFCCFVVKQTIKNI